MADKRVSWLAKLTKKPAFSGPFSVFGGEGGIRTLDAFRHTHFPGVLLRPLGHLTVILFSTQHLACRTKARFACPWEGLIRYLRGRKYLTSLNLKIPGPDGRVNLA